MNHPFWLKLSGRFTDCETCLLAKFQVKIPSFDFFANIWPEVENPVKYPSVWKNFIWGRILLVSLSPTYEEKMSSIGDSHLRAFPRKRNVVFYRG